jgi:hypothetical protein
LGRPRHRAIGVVASVVYPSNDRVGKITAGADKAGAGALLLGSEQGSNGGLAEFRFVW